MEQRRPEAGPAAAEAAGNAGAGRRDEGPAADHPASTKAVDRVSFELLHSAIYHDMRAQWFVGLNRFFLMITIVLGSSAAAAFGSAYTEWGQVFGLLVAVITAISLVWDFSGQARTHAELKRRFYSLLARHQRGASADEVRSDLVMIYADEPPTMCAVSALAHNTAGTSIYGDDYKAVRVGFFRRITRHILTHSGADFARPAPAKG